ncbi:MAG: RNA polymerase sigma-70 factor [Candidatus Babeliales bacterium]
MDQKNDTVLVKKIKQGNEAAFGKLFDRYNTSLFFLAKKYLKDQGLAEDAVQDIFVKLWVKKEALDPSQNIKGFLFTMLKNNLLNTIRKQKSRIHSAISIADENLPGLNHTEDDVIHSEYQELLKRGLNELTEGRRIVFELKVYKGLSNEQIAEQLLVTIHTVKSHYYHGSRFIRTYLEKHAGIRS